MAEQRRCVLLVLPGASLLPLAGVLDALQAANELQEDMRYEAQLCSPVGGMVCCGALALTTQPLAVMLVCHALFVFSAEGAQTDSAILQCLRDQAGRGVALAGVDGGSAVLAATFAGNLGTYQIQWQQQNNCAGAWSDIPGATADTLATGELFEEQCYRAIFACAATGHFGGPGHNVDARVFAPTVAIHIPARRYVLVTSIDALWVCG